LYNLARAISPLMGQDSLTVLDVLLRFRHRSPVRHVAIVTIAGAQRPLHRLFTPHILGSPIRALQAAEAP